MSSRVLILAIALFTNLTHADDWDYAFGRDYTSLQNPKVDLGIGTFDGKGIRPGISAQIGVDLYNKGIIQKEYSHGKIQALYIDLNARATGEYMPAEVIDGERLKSLVLKSPSIGVIRGNFESKQIDNITRYFQGGVSVANVFYSYQDKRPIGLVINGPVFEAIAIELKNGGRHASGNFRLYYCVDLSMGGMPEKTIKVAHKTKNGATYYGTFGACLGGSSEDFDVELSGSLVGYLNEAEDFKNPTEEDPNLMNYNIGGKLQFKLKKWPYASTDTGVYVSVSRDRAVYNSGIFVFDKALLQYDVGIQMFKY